MDIIFEKLIPTWIEEPSCNKCRQQLTLCISYNTNSAGQRKDLNIRVTNPKNAFMLYSLKLNEDDYHNLKSQQGLLIDFPSFPAMFVERLKACESGQDKFELHLIAQTSTAVLQVVEVNPFKHLVHLSLNMSSATDAVVKTYLAECLKDLQTRHKSLQDKADSEAQQYYEKVSSLEESLIQLKSKIQGSERTKELEMSEQSAVMKDQVQKERDAAKQYQEELQGRAQVTEKQLENRIKELEAKSKKLFDEKCRYELQNRELIAKVKIYEEERVSDKAEIKRLKLEKADIDKDKQKDVTEMHSVKTQLAVSRQELKDNDLTICNLREQKTKLEDQKAKLEDQVDTQHYQCVKLENTVRSVSEEVVKGNEIISKMQNEIKNYRSKIKIKQMQMTQQEKTLKENEDETRAQKQKIKSLETEVVDKQNVLDKLEACKQEMEDNIEEYQKTLKSNENVISWLNKQINDKVSLGPRSLPSLLRNADTRTDARADNMRTAEQRSQDMRYGPYGVAIGGAPMNGAPVGGAHIQDGRNGVKHHQFDKDRYIKGISSTPALNGTILHSSSNPPEYHHLSSFDNSKKEDSFLDECYLKNSENLVDDTLKSVSETPNSQVITIGRNRKVLGQKQNKSANSTQSKSSGSLKQSGKIDDPPLMKAYAP